MMQRILESVLWMAPIILQAVIAIVMWVRGLHKRLPYFFSYTTYIVLSNMALIGIHRHPRTYFYGYWVQEVLSWTLGSEVIYEIYANLLKEYAVLQKLGAFLFWIMGLVLVLIALWTAFNVPGSEVSRLLQALLTLERSVRIVQCGLLVVLFVFASFFGLGWKNHLFGIALGFAIFLCMELALVAIRTYTGARQDQLFSWLQSISYNLGVLVWTLYVVKRWRVADLRRLPKTELAAWNDTLQELLHR